MLPRKTVKSSKSFQVSELENNVTFNYGKLDRQFYLHSGSSIYGESVRQLILQ